MKVLFLDIDGVLNSHAYLLANPGAFDRSDPVNMLDPEACALLARVVESVPDLKVVVSSAWRYAHSVDAIATLLARRGVIVDVVGKTPLNGRCRGAEIQAWLDANPGVGRFAIVDDGSDMAHLLPYLVQTSWAWGMQPDHAALLVAMLTS